jgi:hypothetical protein
MEEINNKDNQDEDLQNFINNVIFTVNPPPREPNLTYCDVCDEHIPDNEEHHEYKCYEHNETKIVCNHCNSTQCLNAHPQHRKKNLNFYKVDTFSNGDKHMSDCLEFNLCFICKKTMCHDCNRNWCAIEYCDRIVCDTCLTRERDTYEMCYSCNSLLCNDCINQYQIFNKCSFCDNYACEKLICSHRICNECNNHVCHNCSNTCKKYILTDKFSSACYRIDYENSYITRKVEELNKMEKHWTCIECFNKRETNEKIET